MVSKSRGASPVATVRAVGNLLLSVSAVLLLLDMLSREGQIEIASIIFVIAGVGLRIEAAIRDRTPED
ncbi:hypothetical protein GCM10023191_005210 [Actinoallomurus oryzae]|uniref:Uncharacterized protein n=1 Tax=Actinoallomurus oryzae TaxID=502180 RepID=A0ABP8P818_9ACTN